MIDTDAVRAFLDEAHPPLAQGAAAVAASLVDGGPDPDGDDEARRRARVYLSARWRGKPRHEAQDDDRSESGVLASHVLFSAT